MSFNLTSNPSNVLRFGPAKFDVEWDGVSEAKATFELSCFSSAATYEAIAYPVWTSSGIANFTTSSTTLYTMGTRQFSFDDNGFKLFEPNALLAVTASSGTASVAFSTLTATHSVYAWQLRRFDGTATCVLVTGKLQAEAPNPYSRGNGVSGIVSGATAVGCC